MAGHEIHCFADVLACEPRQISTLDLTRERLTASRLKEIDAVLLGGSGDFSVVSGGPWLSSVLDDLRGVYEQSKPTFASCWGFQAMALAMGGTVVTDPERAEIGTIRMHLSEAGLHDPVFGPLGATFLAQVGHQDTVDVLPSDAVLLASSDQVDNHAFLFDGKPIYCTQFHSELTVQHMMDRLTTYPEYVEKIAGVSHSSFIASLRRTPEVSLLVARFVHHIFGS